MRKPDESLRDFSVNQVTGPESKPPREVSLVLTGEAQTLKPLTELAAAETNIYTFRPGHRKQPLWFRRFIAIGGGLIVIVATVLVSAIFVGLSEPSVTPEVAINALSDLELTPTESLAGLDSFSFPDSASPADGGYETRSNGERKSSRRSLRGAHYKRKLMPPPSMQYATPKFAPTTLVIYAENGVIKSRIEPWL